jgi:hypothetical protein
MRICVTHYTSDELLGAAAFAIYSLPESGAKIDAARDPDIEGITVETGSRPLDEKNARHRDVLPPGRTAPVAYRSETT